MQTLKHYCSMNQKERNALRTIMEVKIKGLVDVIIGAAEPDQVDCEAVAEEVPYGTVTVTAKKGGLDVASPSDDDVLIMANAAILVSFEE